MNVVETNKLIGNYSDFLRWSDAFLETGSCYGRSIKLALEAGYRVIHSVEAKKEFHDHCTKEFWGNDRVNLWHGKSIDALQDMMYNMNPGKPIVCFLDAHVSGEQSAGYQDWVEKQGESDYDQDRVLRAEIKLILAHRQDHVFVIDDQNGSIFYADYIESLVPNKYKYYFYDEQMGENFYKNKMLIAIPNA